VHGKGEHQVRPYKRTLNSYTMNLEPLVSIITPVYNTEKYLAECIESILAQTYQNWEYIIVNNCSTDRTLEIAKKYAEKDARIRIHNNQKFFTLIQNHNVAFQQISPRSGYCKVVHADDWLFPDCIAKMVEVGEKYPSVSIIGSYRLDDVWVNCDGLPYPSTIVSGREICRSTFLGNIYVFGSPTTTLIRSNFIKNRKPFYNENNLHADREVCYDLLQNSDFGFVHQVLTYTRRENEAMSSFARRFNTFLLGELIILKKYGPLYLDGKEFKTLFNRMIKKYCIFLGKNFLKFKEKEFWKYHRDGLRENGFKRLVYPMNAIIFLKRVLNV